MASGFEPLSPSSLPKASPTAAGGPVFSVPSSPAPTSAAMAPGAPDSSASTTFVPVTPRARSAPTVSVQKDGDRITHITIHCSCGEVINLECGY